MKIYDLQCFVTEEYEPESFYILINNFAINQLVTFFEGKISLMKERGLYSDTIDFTNYAEVNVVEEDYQLMIQNKEDVFIENTEIYRVIVTEKEETNIYIKYVAVPKEKYRKSLLAHFEEIFEESVYCVKKYEHINAKPFCLSDMSKAVGPATF